MKRTLKLAVKTGTVIAALVMLSGIEAKAATIAQMTKTNHLTFEAKASSATILDATGQGTGFTNRLPGTGTSLLKNDSNLVKNTDETLTVKSTYTDINVGGVNLNKMETLAVPLTNIGKNDFAFSVVLKNVQVPDMSDQLFAFVGTDAKNIFRFGPHGQGTPDAQLLSVESLNGGDFNYRTSGTITSGDDIKITMTRTVGNTYTIVYTNLTHPALSATETVQFDWLSKATTLYVGVLYSNAGSSVQKTSKIQDFRTYR
jgi:hypothetical protein